MKHDHSTCPDCTKADIRSAMQNMTTEHDSDFDAHIAASSWKPLWRPWVGKNYAKNRIFIFGLNTYADENDPQWRDKANACRDANRLLVAEAVNGKHNPFQCTSEMFLDGAKKESKPESMSCFWSAVAFINYYQIVGAHSNDTHPKCPGAKCASAKWFHKMLEILKPELCLFWTTEIFKLEIGYEYEAREKTDGAIPRVFKRAPVPTIGIVHPSRPRKFSRDKWLEFLCRQPESKKPVKELLQHLAAA